MNIYEKLQEQACKEGIDIDIVDYNFQSDRIKGLYCDGMVAISNKIDTSVEKACVLAEEIGHYHTAVGDITDQSDVENRKQELKGRLWAYNQQIGLIGLVNAYKQGCHSRHEAAEYLGVTEEFFQDAIDRYRSKYGVCAEVDNYVVFFEPSLAVMKKSEIIGASL